MKRVMVAILLCGSLGASYFYFRTRSQTKPRAGAARDNAAPQIEESSKPADPAAAPLIVVAGPLANWMQGRDEHSNNDPAPRKSDPSDSGDHIAPSPVGTSSAIVRKTFALANSANFLFEVPPHAASPQLNGTYRSFVRDIGTQSSADAADIDLLLMNDHQFEEFSQGRSSDVVYSVDSSHEQDVSFLLPATLDRPAHYHLVFRNATREAGKKVVQADFRVDF